MSIREFTDDEGVRWQVWKTLPGRTGAVSPGLEDGWLTFAAGVHRRRLAPIPSVWDRAADDPELRMMLALAEPVQEMSARWFTRRAD